MLPKLRIGARKGILGAEIAERALQAARFAPCADFGRRRKRPQIARRRSAPEPLLDADLAEDAPPVQGFFSQPGLGLRFAQVLCGACFGPLRPIVHGAAAEAADLLDQEFFDLVGAAQRTFLRLGQSRDRLEAFHEFRAASQCFQEKFFAGAIVGLAMRICHGHGKLSRSR